jgi:hypothetical protein
MSSRALALLVLCSSALGLTGCGSSKSAGTGPGSPGSTASQGSTTTATQTTSSAPGTGGPTQSGGGKLGPEGIPIELGPSLAPASTTTPGTPVDGIRCPRTEQLAYHIHVHLQVYVEGQPRQLPGGIGTIEPAAEPTRLGPLYAATRCYYWLHTHAADGIIHIESPLTTLYTLGEFFDEWRQPLTSDQVAGAHGPVTALVNGKRWTKSPRAIPLRPHAVIQLEVGKPLVPFHNVSFAGAGL